LIDPATDFMQITLQVKIIYALRILRLVVIILFLAYFIGTLFLALSKHTTFSEDDFTFYNEYELKMMSDLEILTRMIYFVITTLTTIGFGDFNPKSMLERLAVIFILVLGVCCFSFMMGQLISVVVDYRKLTTENEDAKELSRWLGIV
jgi:hypothetical protein